MWAWYRQYRRRRLLARPFPAGWEAILCRNVAHYGLLDDGERARLRDVTRVLVAEKVWEGAGGLPVTEEMRVTIAAQAALPLLGLAHDYFRRVLSVIVYPSAFAILEDRDGDGWERGTGAAGQAVYRGPVIVAWDRALAEGRDPSAGHNLVIHEFAHQLDFLDGLVNGTPVLRDAAQVERWRTAMTAEYERLRRDLDEGRDTFLGAYAARDEGEFFAVASERFFTQPHELRQRHGPVYAVLAEYYGVEPVRWFDSTPGRQE
jgi:Mlc titration factor MtfA (ptsG expression regulator)